MLKQKIIQNDVLKLNYRNQTDPQQEAPWTS